mmetsp:Transcript_47167/g.151373  ORF Transcript_47167/g.151373 Transcript_47167/m.151373 type:complete len:310 (+) Transcript_47167:386-1315(+)
MAVLNVERGGCAGKFPVQKLRPLQAGWRDSARNFAKFLVPLGVYGGLCISEEHPRHHPQGHSKPLQHMVLDDSETRATAQQVQNLGGGALLNVLVIALNGLVITSFGICTQATIFVKQCLFRLPVLGGDEQHGEFIEHQRAAGEGAAAKVDVEGSLGPQIEFQLWITLTGQVLGVAELTLGLAECRFNSRQVPFEDRLEAASQEAPQLTEAALQQLLGGVAAEHAVKKSLDEDGDGDVADLLVLHCKCLVRASVRTWLHHAGDAESPNQTCNVTPHLRAVICERPNKHISCHCCCLKDGSLLGPARKGA